MSPKLSREERRKLQEERRERRRQREQRRLVLRLCLGAGGALCLLFATAGSMRGLFGAILAGGVLLAEMTGYIDPFAGTPLDEADD